MILLDANLLIYATDRDSPQHEGARSWIESALSGTETVGLSWAAILAFLRVVTRPGILRHPLSVLDAISIVDSVLSRSVVRILDPGAGHWATLRALLTASGTAGNLTNDAHLAALALEHGATIASADYDFRRFAGVAHANPLETP